MRLFYILILLSLLSCGKKESPIEFTDFEKLQVISDSDLGLSGKVLSDAYCSACHLKPDPSLLDKQTWENGVLPDMRHRLGLINEQDFGAAVGEDNDAPAGIYSERRLITQKQWDAIQEFYISNAPDSLLSIPEDEDLEIATNDFKVVKPQLANLRPSLSTFVSFDKENKELYVGDRLNHIFHFDPMSLQLLDSIRTPSPASSIQYNDESIEILTMGFMDPSNYAIGKLQYLDKNSVSAVGVTVLDTLRRPVHIAYGDLTDDGSNEIVICNFGNHIGNLSYYVHTNGVWEPRLLNDRPGARQTILEDLNGDGLLDVLVLMTQAKEGVYAYINQGNGEFKEELWLAFNPVYGSSNFDFVDIDGDGLKDLVLVHGDNADYSPIFKPYHGLRIYKNHGNNNFREAYFYPMHGATGLVVDSFGDQDSVKNIGVISYFPHQDDDGLKNNFLYFKQKKGFDFSVKKVEGIGEYSFLTIDKGDLNGDGVMDILLGSFDFATMYSAKRWMPFLVLESLADSTE